MGLFDIFKKKEEVIQYDQPIPVTPNGNYIPIDITESFVFRVEDVFSIRGRGTVVTGEVLRGTLSINDGVMIKESNVYTSVTGIEQFRKQLTTTTEGDKVGLLLADVGRESVSQGMYIVK